VAEVHLNDKNGAPIQISNPLPVSVASNPLTTDLKLRVSSTPYGYDIAEGNLPNHSRLTKMGYNADIGNTEEVLWSVGGAYVWPVAAQRMEVVSSSTDDDGSPGGTGAQTVKIWYLTDTFVEKTETVTLDGTTVVPTVAADIYRINAFRVITAGAGGVAAGNIDIRNTADTPIYSRIPLGLTRARNSIYTVPIGKVLYITSFSASAGAPAAGHYTTFTLRAKYDELAQAISTLFYPYIELGVQDGSVTREFQIPIKFTAGVDIKVSGISDNASAAVRSNVTYSGWLETP
jgi:hypothetical protein